MLDYCHWMQNGKGRYVFIPGCIGGASRGPECCTCLAPSDRLEIMQKRMDILASRLSLVENWINDNDPSNPLPLQLYKSLNEPKTNRAMDMKLVGDEPMEEV